jgi:hypothetical protein
MKIRSIVLAAVVSGVAWTAASAEHADDALAGALEKVSQEQIAAFNREDATATMSYADTRSPSFAEAKETLAAYFKDQDLKAEQVSFHYIGHDDEFAIARVKVKVTSPGTEGFEPNVVDTFTIFHQENGAWKVWDGYLIGGTLVK